MKKQELSKTFDILYRGRRIYQRLSYEDCADVLEELSQKYYKDETFDANLLELEENHG
jgi:phage-related minor tail protein